HQQARPVVADPSGFQEPVGQRLVLDGEVPLLAVTALDVAKLAGDTGANSGKGAQLAAAGLVEALRERIVQGVVWRQATSKGSYHRRLGIEARARIVAAWSWKVEDAVAAANDRFPVSSVGEAEAGTEVVEVLLGEPAVAAIHGGEHQAAAQVQAGNSQR